MSMLWGSTFVAQQIGMQRGLGPLTFNALRFALGACVLLPLVCRRRTGLPVTVPWRGSILAGLFLFAAAGLQQVGLLYTTSANAGFITSLYILFVPLLGLLFGHRAPRSLWAGALVCVAGLYLLSLGSDITMRQGDVLVLVCAVLWAAQIVTIQHLARFGDPFKIAVIQFVVCAVLSAVGALLVESLTLKSLYAGSGAVAYAGVFSVGIAFTLQIVCQKHCPLGTAAVIMSMEAVFAALAGYLVLGQTLSARAWGGCFLILCGVLVVQLVPLMRRR